MVRSIIVFRLGLAVKIALFTQAKNSFSNKNMSASPLLNNHVREGHAAVIFEKDGACVWVRG
jgi:hypothetical protein